MSTYVNACAILMPLQAEVQQLHADGSIVLHTRSQKYGKVSIPCQSQAAICLSGRQAGSPTAD